MKLRSQFFFPYKMRPFWQNEYLLFPKKITIQGRDGRKVFIVLCTLGKLADSQNPPGKSPSPKTNIPLAWSYLFL